MRKLFMEMVLVFFLLGVGADDDGEAALFLGVDVVESGAGEGSSAPEHEAVCCLILDTNPCNSLLQVLHFARQPVLPATTIFS